MTVMMDLYDRIVDKELTIRRVNVVAVNLIKEDEISEELPEQLDLFPDYKVLEKQKKKQMTVRGGFRKQPWNCRGSMVRTLC